MDYKIKYDFSASKFDYDSMRLEIVLNHVKLCKKICHSSTDMMQKALNAQRQDFYLSKPSPRKYMILS